MEIDRERQAQALAKVKEIIADQERKREAMRVEKGVQLFLDGQFDILQNDEFVENLASYILNKFITEEPEDARRILDTLGHSLRSELKPTRERSLMVVSVLSEIILEEDFAEFRGALARLLTDWLEFETEYIAGFEFVCSQLQKIIIRMLQEEQWLESEHLLNIFFRISTGAIYKSTLIKGVTTRVHEGLADPDILDKLINVYLDESDERRLVAESLLMHLGKMSATFLVQKLIFSNDKDERFILIDLIPKIGSVSVPVLTGCLADDPPWFVIRNIILIVSRLEDPGLFQIVEPFLTHKDMRVQQQVINCIEMLGGTHMRTRLIQAMTKINDELKGQLVMQLGQFEGADVGDALLDLLEKRTQFASHVREDLLSKLCAKISNYPSERAVACLKNLMAERSGRFGEADKIAREAATALQMIEMNKKIVKADPVVVEEGPPEDEVSSDIEKDIFAVLDDAADEGVKRMASADGREGVPVGTGVPEATVSAVAPQTKGIVKNRSYYSSQDYHLSVWSKLYEQMSTDEANEFFSMLKPVTYQANEVIVRQGACMTDLFFIDGGFAEISHVDDNAEILLTSLQSGELIGGDGFIEDREWAISFQAQTELHVRVLTREKYESLTGKFPELGKKLRYYCNHYDVVPYLIYLTEDPKCEPLDTALVVRSKSLIRGESGDFVEDDVAGKLQYIACGGYCVTLPYIHKDNAFAVLGRQTSSEIELENGSMKKSFGVIVGAGGHGLDPTAFFLYVKFYHPFEKASYLCRSLDLI